MSRIFDALHRVEEDRRGTPGSPSITATELLERAERQARGQRNAEGRVARIVETTLAGGDEKRLIGRSEEESPQKPGQLDTVLPDVQSLHLTLPLPNRLVALSDPSSPAAEAFRLVSIRLREMRRERPLKSILISSTSPQEGKSLIAANLACTLARVSRQTVLLLEGDVRRPSQEALFRVEPMPGLCEHFHGARSLRDSIYRLDEAGIWLLPAGRAHDNSPEVIQAATLSALTAQVAEWFDWVIIDSPPILPLADTSVWEKVADGLLLVARRGVTAKRKLKRGAEVIDQKKLIGMILNSSTGSTDEDYYYYKRPSSGPDPEDVLQP
jgi:capsular exopolysaccharide synthesis family protein